MENLFTVIACIIGIIATLVIVLGIFALEALIIWGVGNAIIYLLQGEKNRTSIGF